MEGNGRQIIKMGTKGHVWFQFGERDPFRVDVILVHNDYAILDQSFRDAEGKVQQGRSEERDQAVHRFVSGLAGTDADGEGAISMAEAMEFLARLTEEANRLIPFFAVRSSDGRSSPKSTAVTFSEETPASP